jgi:hypothetical protein
VDVLALEAGQNLLQPRIAAQNLAGAIGLSFARNDQSLPGGTTASSPNLVGLPELDVGTDGLEGNGCPGCAAGSAGDHTLIYQLYDAAQFNLFVSPCPNPLFAVPGTDWSNPSDAVQRQVVEFARSYLDTGRGRVVDPGPSTLP